MNNNFNILNQIGRFIQNVAKPNTPPPPPVGPQGGEKTFQMPFAPEFENMNPSDIMKYYLQDATSKNMEISQSLNYMKDVLNLPKEFKDLVLKFSDLNTINIMNLKALISSNQKDALQKIIQQISDMARKNIDTSQMKDIMAIISSPNAVDCAKAVLLMYIPFLPLSVKSENLDWEIIKEEEQKKEGGEDEIRILISTKNFQNIEITIYSNSSEINIIISTNPIFPYKDLEKNIIEYAKENNYKVKIAHEEIKQEGIKETKQSVKILSGEVLNSCTMLVMHSIINLVLTIDNKE